MKAKYIFARSYLYILLFVLYAPIFVIAIFSFTEAKVLGNWTGFSTHLYSSLFTPGTHVGLMKAVENTLLIGVIASTAATLLGTIAAIGIFNTRNKFFKGAMNTLNNIPLLNADIITGVSLFLLFVSLGVSQGYVTLTLAHITFCTPYVVLSVLPRLQQMNPYLYEAALDLGAPPFKALRKVVIPEIAPGMASGFMLSFLLSIDDFEITIFNLGNKGLETLSTYIYADSRKGGLTPELRPLLTIFFIVVLVLLVFYNLWTLKKTQKK
ncbi:MAG: ABC transporter permease [Bacteroidales bacterium]|nr:ABC transporter permease [Bacteroidales bacterium]